MTVEMLIALLQHTAKPGALVFVPRLIVDPDKDYDIVDAKETLTMSSGDIIIR